MQSTKEVNQSLAELTADILKAFAAKLSPEQNMTSLDNSSRSSHQRSRSNSAYKSQQRKFQTYQQQTLENKNKRPSTPKQSGSKSNSGQYLISQPVVVKPKVQINKVSPKELALAKIRNNEKLIILMRGCPGSGKTTFAHQLRGNGVVYSADDYFLRNGRYEFDPNKLSEAHSHVKTWCLRAIESGRTPIIIDNTNLEAWEMIPYVNMALKYQYFILLLEPETPWKHNAAQLTAKNTHNISYSKIVRMLDIFDRNLTTAHLIKACKVNNHGDHKPFRGTPNNTILNNQIIKPLRTSPSPNAQTRTSRPRITHKNESSPITIPAATPQANGSDDGWSSNEEEWNLQQQQIKKSKSVPNMLNQMGTLNVHRSSPFVPVNDSPRKLLSHMNDLLDLDFNNVNSLPQQNLPLSDYERSVGMIDGAISSNWEGTSFPVAKMIQDSETHKKISEIKAERDAKKETIRESEASEDPIKVLKSFFSSVPDDNLRDIYERCAGDLQWVVNFLLDAGYEMSNPIVPEVEQIINKCESSPELDLIDLSAKQEQSDAIDALSAQIPTIYVSDEDHKPPRNEATFQFRLDAGFAKILQDSFGPVGYNLSSDSFSGNELDVNIPMELAAAIHECWSTSLREKFNQEDNELIQMLTDEDYAKMIQDKEYENLNGFFPHRYSDEFPALSTEVTPLGAGESWSHLSKQDLALKIKQRQIYDQFPKIDRKAIDEMLDANNSRYTETVSTLKLLYEPDSLPLHVVAPEYQEEYNNLIMKEFLEENVEQATVEDEFEEPTFAQLRDHAQYLLGLRKECFDKAKIAFQNGSKEVASFYSQKGHQYTYAIQVANKRAAGMILEITNQGLNPNTLDLHLLTTREALKALTDFLNRKQNDLMVSNNGRNTMVVYVITGKGNHSIEGISKIRSAVDSYLNSKNYSCYQVNAGCVEIILRKSM